MKEVEYLDILCSQLEILREDVVIHRLMSDVTERDMLVAPCWRSHPGDFARKVERELRQRSSWQGSNCPQETGLD